MTNPSDPGHPPRPPEHGGGPGGPYGPPPPPPGPQQTGPIPGPFPPGPVPGPGDREHGPQDEHLGRVPPPRDPGGRSLLGALFDLNFDHMVTPRLAKIIYGLALVPSTLLSLLMLGYGAQWLAQGARFFGFLLIFSAPFTWLFQILGMRVCMEFVINQFKISEYLRVIKDKD